MSSKAEEQYCRCEEIPPHSYIGLDGKHYYKTCNGDEICLCEDDWGWHPISGLPEFYTKLFLEFRHKPGRYDVSSLD